MPDERGTNDNSGSRHYHRVRGKDVELLRLIRPEMNPPPDSVVQRQLEILCNTLTQMEADMIDPVEYGQLKGSVDSLKREMGDLKKRQERMDEKLDQVLSKLSEARGGWRLLLALGGAAATLGGGITWLFTHTITVGPKG